MESMSDVSTIGTESSNDTVEEEIENIFQETEFSIVDLDIQIQNERILAILNETIYKTEIVIFLLMSDENVKDSIREVLPNEHVQMVEKIYRRFEYPGKIIEPFYEAATEDEIQNIIIQPGTKTFPELSNVIWIFKNNLKTKPIIKNFIEGLQMEFQNDESRSCNVILYLNGLIKLRAKIKERMDVFADEKLKKDIFVRNLTKTNKALKLKIADLTKRLAQEKQLFVDKFGDTEDDIKKLQEQLDFLSTNCKAEITNILLETENVISEEDNFHSSKMSILAEKDSESKEHYECLLEEHLDMENHLRKNRCEIETKLLRQLKKYDEDVGYRQTTLDDMSQCYEEEQQQFKELQERFDLQEIEYIPLMAQKEEEYQREVLIKMTTFMMEHAARVIQRMWRKILAGRAEKKRQKKMASKKKKGGKKKSGGKARKSSAASIDKVARKSSAASIDKKARKSSAASMDKKPRKKSDAKAEKKTEKKAEKKEDKKAEKKADKKPAKKKK